MLDEAWLLLDTTVTPTITSSFQFDITSSSPFYISRVPLFARSPGPSLNDIEKTSNLLLSVCMLKIEIYQIESVSYCFCM
ncbi:hypothetical protein BpHYR1_032207 [Brachionus plicatilis]|uniref:Uncharacterized protein n=1 Tax=Brachionus plicatilis TaxID=10195 RepID=A0A3M7Q7F2_BRAPC|nr:hypothetical protein BpHYR1_032207 [Brachionus plicatilis]